MEHVPLSALEKMWEPAAVAYRPSPEQEAVHAALCGRPQASEAAAGEVPDVTLVVVGGGEQCIAGGTFIHMADGRRVEVQDVQAGDQVLSLDEASYQLVPGVVQERFDVGDRQVLELEFSTGRRITCTPQHKFLIGRGWVSASELLKEYFVVMGHQLSGATVWARVVDIRSAGLTPCFDLAVEPHHSYVANDIITHNSGKSYAAGMHAFARWFTDPLIWLVGDRYEDCRKEFDYIKEAGLRLGCLREGDYSKGEDGPWHLRWVNGHEVKVLSSDDVTRLFGEAPDGVVMCEPGRQTWDAFRRLLVRTGHRAGWFLVCGTFEHSTTRGRWFADLWRELQGENSYRGVSLSLPTWSNRSLYPLGVSDPKYREMCRRLRESNPRTGEEEIGERYLGIPRVPQGLVFPEFRRQAHVRETADYVAGAEVQLWVDPGYFPSAYAVLWVQSLGGQDRVFDEVYEHRMTNAEVLTLCLERPAFRDVTRVVLDVAAGAHAGAQDSAYETWTAALAGRGISIGGQFVRIEERNNRVHDHLRLSPLTGQPLLVFHPRCRSTIWEFEEGYRLRERSGTGVIGSDNPIDRDNHAVSAAGYGLLDRYGYSDQPRSLLPRSYIRSGLGRGAGAQDAASRRVRAAQFGGR